MVCHQCWFIKKSAYLRMGLYDSKYKILSDKIYFIEMLKKHQIKYFNIDKIVAIYKGGGISSNIELKKKMKPYHKLP